MEEWIPAELNSDPVEHSKRRRLMGQLFNRSQMHKLEGLMLQHIDNFVRIATLTKNEVNLMPACRALEADIMCIATSRENLIKTC